MEKRRGEYLRARIIACAVLPLGRVPGCAAGSDLLPLKPGGNSNGRESPGLTGAVGIGPICLFILSTLVVFLPLKKKNSTVPLFPTWPGSGSPEGASGRAAKGPFSPGAVQVISRMVAEEERVFLKSTQGEGMAEE